MKSYTLIEILVVISIILILIIFIVPNYHLANSRITVERAAYRLARDLRNAEEMSMSSRKTSSSTFGSALFPKGGYGLYFGTTNFDSYILFADCNGDGIYATTSGALSCTAAGSGPPFYPETIEEIFLESGVVISATNPLGERLSSVTFIPPDPAITMQPNLPFLLERGIELTSANDPSKHVAVYVNRAGLIEIQH